MILLFYIVHFYCLYYMPRVNSLLLSILTDHIWFTKLVRVRNLDSDRDHDLIMAVLTVSGSVGTNESTCVRDYRKLT